MSDFNLFDWIKPDFFVVVMVAIMLYCVIKMIGASKRTKTALDLAQEGLELQKQTIERLDAIIKEIQKLQR